MINVKDSDIGHGYYTFKRLNEQPIINVGKSAQFELHACSSDKIVYSMLMWMPFHNCM